MTTYKIEYQTGAVVGNHRTLAAAERHLARCQRAAKRGGDTQTIRIIVKNPVVLWGHDHSVPAIGRAGWVKRGEDSVKAKIFFASTPFAQDVKKRSTKSRANPRTRSLSRARACGIGREIERRKTMTREQWIEGKEAGEFVITKGNQTEILICACGYLQSDSDNAANHRLSKVCGKPTMESAKRLAERFTKSDEENE